MAVPLEHQRAQGGQPWKQRCEQGEELLPDRLGVVVGVGPAAGRAVRHYTAGDVDLHHRLEREAVEAAGGRKPGGELRREQVPKVEQERTAGAPVQPGHEVQHVRRPAPPHHHRVLQYQRHGEMGLDVLGVRCSVGQALGGERRRQVEVAGEWPAVPVPPADVVAHPGRTHRPGVRVEQGELRRLLELGTVEVEVNRVEEHRHLLPGLPEHREERRLGARAVDVQRRRVLDQVE